MSSDQRDSGKTNFKPIKASWTPGVHQIFVDICLEEISKGNKPGTCFNREGWKNIEESFHKRSGTRYQRKQLKNHWDNIKDEWKIWCKLTGTRSMKWDPSTRKFGASEQDWADYIKTNPEAAKYRYREILFADKLDVIYDGTIITGETEPPTQRRKHNNDLITSILHIGEPEVMRLDSTTNCEQGGTRPDSGANCEPLLAMPSSRVERLCDAVESRSNVTVHSSPTKLKYSIGECIECLDGMDEVEQGSDLYLFALDLFLKKEYREIFLNLKKTGVRIAWLQRLQLVGPPLPIH